MLAPSTRPIFLLGAHLSGTHLLRALFDGHPELCVLPEETHPFAHLGYWTRTPQYASVRDAPERDAILASMAESLGLHEAPAREHLAERLPAQPLRAVGDTLSAYFDAAARALGRDATRCRITEHSAEHAEFAADLAAAFPEATFLHVVRNPYAHLVALREEQEASGDDGYPWLGPALETVVQQFYYLSRNLRLLPRYHVVRYENLVASARPVLETLCGDVGLAYDRSLLIPTTMGAPWKETRSEKRSLEGVVPGHVGAWQHAIKPLEIALVDKHLSHALDTYGYDRIEPSGKIKSRVKGESLRVYAANRELYRAA